MKASLTAQIQQKNIAVAATFNCIKRVKFGTVVISPVSYLLIEEFRDLALV